MFGGPPEGAETTWDNGQIQFRIVDDNHKDISPVVGHTMIKYKNVLIVWGGYFHSDNNDFQYRPSTYLYILPAGLLAGCKTIKWILYHVPNGDVPSSTSGACAVLFGYNIYVFGGYVRRSTPNNILEGHSCAMYVLDLLKEEWSIVNTTSGSLIPTPRDKLAGWLYKDRCYYFGGYGPCPFDMPNPEVYLKAVGEFVADETSPYYWNNQLLVFDPDPRNPRKWRLAKAGGSVPSARAACSSTYLPAFDNILLFGGRNRNRRLNDLYLLDLASLVWTQVETTEINRPEGRTWCSLSTIFPNQALIYGGYSNEAKVLYDFWRITIRKDSQGHYVGEWTAADIEREDKSFRLWHTGDVIEGQLFVCGGTDADLEERVKTVGILRRRVEPLSLMTLCLGAVFPVLKDASPLPVPLQIRCAWARFILSWGYQALHMDVEKFRSFNLLNILDMSS